MNQFSLEIPIDLVLKLKSHLYYKYEKINCGVISQLALLEGEYKVKAIKKNDLIYKIVTEHGQSFFASLEKTKGEYNIIGFVNHIPREKNNKTIIIDNVTDNGKSLRKAQVGSVYSLLTYN